MAVAFDANASAVVKTNGGTTLTLTGLTVGTGANRLLMAMLSFSADPGAFTECNWDSAGTPQACTFLVTAGAARMSKMYYLIAPTSGNLSLKATWTNSVQAILNACSFTGVNQAGGTTTFPTTPTTTGSGTTLTVTVVSTTGRMTLASAAGGSGDILSIDTQTTLGLAHSASSGAQWGGSYGAGTASNAHTFTFQSTTLSGTGCDIATTPPSGVFQTFYRPFPYLPGSPNTSPF